MSIKITKKERKAIVNSKRDQATLDYRYLLHPVPTSLYMGDFEERFKVLENQLISHCMDLELKPEQFASRIQQGKEALHKQILKFYGMNRKDYA